MKLTYLPSCINARAKTFINKSKTRGTITHSNKIDEAVPLFEVAIETEPESEKLWLSLIDALIKGERYDEARATIDQGKDLGINPDKLEGIKNLISSSFNFPEYVKLIIENYKAGNLPETERLALIITRELPDDAFAWKVLGTVYEQTGRTSDALMANTKVTDFSPEEPEGHNNLGVTYKSLGRLEEAEASFRQALLLQSDYAKAYNNLGTTLEEQGRLSEAEESISRAVELDPDYVEAQNNLGNVLTRLGKYAEAEQTFKQALALKPENAEVHGNLGSMFQHDGRLNESEFSLRQAIELNPDYVEAHTIWAMCCKS